jgi:IS5 family transposase
MKQVSLGTGFEKYSKTTRREQFLADMDRIVPWAELCARIAPYYPQAGDGRPPKELELMLRIYFLQQWFNLSDPGVEEALYDSRCMQAFAGLDLGEMPVPDESTICRFRHRLERHALGRKLFADVHRHLKRQGITISTGTIVDATIISAPSSTKNRERRRDPDMHQTKKGNQWYFGMKAHLGVDSHSKLIHAVVATAANVHDAACLPNLLHGEETRVWGDRAYQGQTDVIRDAAPRARDFTHRRCRYRGRVDAAERAKNTTKSRVRSRVEHSIHVLKCIFGFVKVRYRGLAKNAHRLWVTCALANLYLVRRRLLRLAQA